MSYFETSGDSRADIRNTGLEPATVGQTGNEPGPRTFRIYSFTGKNNSSKVFFLSEYENELPWFDHYLPLLLISDFPSQQFRLPVFWTEINFKMQWTQKWASLGSIVTFDHSSSVTSTVTSLWHKWHCFLWHRGQNQSFNWVGDWTIHFQTERYLGN